LADSETLQRAYERCRDITRTHARNFHYGIRLTPEPQRDAVYAVYAWMRQADDLVDSCDASDISSLELRINSFRDRTARSLQGYPPAGANEDPIWLALADSASRFHLSPQHFFDMLDGQMDDAHRSSYETIDQLLQYCRRVASTVGLICIDVWGYADTRAPLLAADRGIAFQLTNILRDVAEDYDIGRTYLPREDFDRLNLTPDDLRHWRKPEACHRLMMHNINRAADFYERSAPLDGMIRHAGRPTLWAMTTIYRRLLHKIAADPRRVVSGRRVRVSSLHKSAIAIRAKWLSRFTAEASPAVAGAKSTA
jgi:phytoene synthase